VGLYGIRFSGHPNLKRILMWEGFAGHPMRKDWKEPYYEQEHKPFDSRWPKGYARRAEDLNAYGKNVQYPADFNFEDMKDVSEEAVYNGIPLGVDVEQLSNNGELQTDRLVVNPGPQHPKTHGVFRTLVTLRGETIEYLEPVIGYLHRNYEQISERNT
jgi:hypothetical protein